MSLAILKMYRFAKIFFRKLQEDHITAYSAMSAYFLLMSFVPFLMILLMLAKYLPFSKNDVLSLLNVSILIQENVFLQEILKEIFQQNSKTVLGITFLFLLWTSSKSIWGFIKGLNAVYDIDSKKGNIQLRFTAILYTTTFLFIITAALVLLVFGNTVYQRLIMYYPFLKVIGIFLFQIRNILSLLFLSGFFLLFYVHIPTRKASIPSQLFGAVFTASGWTLYSFFFSIYVTYFSGYTRLYGGLGTVLLFFLWLYMLMYFIFLGAEINYFLSHKGRIH